MTSFDLLMVLSLRQPRLHVFAIGDRPPSLEGWVFAYTFGRGMPGVRNVAV